MSVCRACRERLVTPLAQPLRQAGGATLLKGSQRHRLGARAGAWRGFTGDNGDVTVPQGHSSASHSATSSTTSGGATLPWKEPCVRTSCRRKPAAKTRRTSSSRDQGKPRPFILRSSSWAGGRTRPRHRAAPEAGRFPHGCTTLQQHAAALAAALTTHPQLPSGNQCHLPSSWEDGQGPAPSVPSMSCRCIAAGLPARRVPAAGEADHNPSTELKSVRRLTPGTTPPVPARDSPCRQRRRRPRPARHWPLSPPAPRSLL